MEQLERVFNYGDNEIRTVMIDGDPWFVARDVCGILGITDARKSVGLLDEDERNTIPITDALGRTQETWTINEPGLYSLILRSRKPEAREFKRWITHEVLPSIRQNGMYATDSLLDDPDLLLKTVTKLTEERRARLAAEEMAETLRIETSRQAVVIEEQSERLTYLDRILQSEDTMNITQIAADYDMTARKLNNILKDAGIQRKTGGQWVLCARYHHQGLTKSSTTIITLETGGTKTVINTRWTQAGRLLIHRVLTERGIGANLDRGINAEVTFFERPPLKAQNNPPKITLNLQIKAS